MRQACFGAQLPSPLQSCRDLCTGTVASRVLAQCRNSSGRRYSLDLRVVESKRSAVVAAVLRISPAARLTETGAEHLSFSLPQASVDLPSLFEEVRHHTV